MANGKFISYLRVSTTQQGVSALSLEAQRAAVQSHLNGGKWRIVAEVVEVESGRTNDRPELSKALRLCRLHNATLLVAKLDRLSRSLAFLANLMEAKVPFTAADMPEADETHLHMMAVFAQHEARAISSRTKAALRAAKARGTVLGGRRVSAKRFAEVAAEGRKASAVVRSQKATAYSVDVFGIIEDVRQADGAETLREIAAGLNERGIGTPRGGQWSAVQVQRVLNREAT
jgi:DNA invertase Pin-like site-specific DNA recombinase